ncbi:hypothetical protein LTR53_011861 [Teratosphaeriaceae sp. CCFEE 6253]|nr:hypothetical protein LTR53_011861 [Teratosphaeriaceae sp. CCFEE 6253]
MAMQTRGRALAERETALAARESETLQIGRPHSRSLKTADPDYERRYYRALDENMTATVAAAAQARDQARIIAEMATRLNLHAAQGLRKKANLLSLPPELRARIHHFAMPRSAFCIDGVRTRSQDLKSSHWKLHTHEPPLALTCREIRSSVLPVFYAQSTFSRHIGPNAAYLRSLLAAFEASLGEHAKSLRNITLTRKLEPDCRPHPGRGSRWYLKNPAFEVTLSLTRQGAVAVKCVLTSAVHEHAGQYMMHDDLVEEYCACHLLRVAASTAASGVDGRRLLGMVRACLPEEVSVLEDSVCEACGMPAVDITC